MAFPFDEGPIIDIEAQIMQLCNSYEIMQCAIHRERVIRARYDILAFPGDYLRERYRFSVESLILFEQPSPSLHL